MTTPSFREGEICSIADPAAASAVLLLVMRGLDLRIHAAVQHMRRIAWTAGSSPAVTMERLSQAAGEGFGDELGEVVLRTFSLRHARA